MKKPVISLQQPWATLLVLGYKGPETRSRKTKHRGPLLIHASKKFTHENKALCKKFPFNIFIQNPDKLPLGGIIGEVNIDSVHHTEDIRNSLTKIQLAFGDYSDGRYAYKNSNQHSFTDPIRCDGSLALPWQFEGEVPESKLFKS